MVPASNSFEEEEFHMNWRIAYPNTAAVRTLPTDNAVDFEQHAVSSLFSFEEVRVVFLLGVLCFMFRLCMETRINLLIVTSRAESSVPSRWRTSRASEMMYFSVSFLELAMSTMRYAAFVLGIFKTPWYTSLLCFCTWLNVAIAMSWGIAQKRKIESVFKEFKYRRHAGNNRSASATIWFTHFPHLSSTPSLERSEA